ncbi:MAG: hypothetical protein LBJ23_00955, partial [Tannerella sp.]|nr:hypothetical protein [Tannerella sp.]
MKRRYISNRITRFAAGTAFCLMLLLICGNTAVAAEDETIRSEYSYRRYTTADGLPGVSMQALLKDAGGLLWQGTVRGASSFDGFDFTPCALDSFPNVERIEEINGQIRFLWGGEMFYPATGKRVTLSDTLTFNPHNSYSLPPNFYVFENLEGKKYFVTVENDRISRMEDISQLQNVFKYKPYLDVQRQELYIPDNPNRQVCIYSLTAKTSRTVENVMMESFFRHSRLGLLGIGDSGIYRMEGDRAELYVPLSFERKNKIAKETRDGDLYVTDFYNIYRISGEQVEHLYHNSGAFIWDMALDDDENLWVATNRGLYNFFHFAFLNYRIPDHNIQSVTQDERGTYWFAGNDDDIFSLSDGRLERIDYPLNPKINTISFNFVFSHHLITYFLIRDGVLIHENGHFHWADLPGENQYYNNIVAYGENLLVTGTNTVFEITPQGKAVKTHTEKDLKITGYPGIAVDRDNRIIVGGREGLSILEKGEVTVLKNRNTPESDIVCIDYGNHVFSVAKKRLNLIEGDSIKTVCTFDNDYIRGILPFDDENMIVATLKGFYIFNSKKYFETGEVQLLFYNHNNGMNGIEPLFGKLFLDNSHNVWMPTSEGIVRFDPYKLIRQISAPNLTVLNISVSTDNVNWQPVGKDSLKLDYMHNDIRFSYIGLCYSAAENVRYRYRLLGFQDEWSEPVKQREVTFNNLPPGDYTFEIYADAGTDESRSETQSLAFTIRPAFWQTAWFLAACIIFLIFSGAGVALFIQRRKNRALLEKLRTEKELNELRISSIRLKAIPHFNANVLAAIEYYIANRTKKDAMRILAIYSDFTLKTLTDVDRAARSLSEELAYV